MNRHLAILNELFSRVCVLYVPGRNVSQRERLKQQLADVKVDWIEGVSAGMQTVDELREKVIMLSGGKRVNPSIPAHNLACWLSYHFLFTQIAEGEHQSVLILQDDAWFLPDAARRIAHYREELNAPPILNGWAALWLSQHNPASALDACFAPHHKTALPILPGQEMESSDAYFYWKMPESLPLWRHQHAGGRKLIVRSDGSVLDHVVLAASERVNLVALAITQRAVRRLLQPSMMLTPTNEPFTTDWWVGRLTEPSSPIGHQCFILTPWPVWHSGYDELSRPDLVATWPE